MTATEPTSEPDTRARRRARFRDEAQDVAVAAFLERGYDHVTMGEIAQVLDVSERTLFRYFPTKESLLDPAHEELVASLVSELASRPAHESAFTAVRESLRALGDELSHDIERLAARMEIVESNPQVQAHLLQRQTELEEAIAEVVAARAGITDPADLRPRLFAATATCTFRVAVEQWIVDDDRPDLLATLDEALDLAATGLADL
ncbi:MAG: acyl-CoA-like ligand-binding transcription factor [Acidimicrobiales bacterium]